jgi:hypothetical protein
MAAFDDLPPADAGVEGAEGCPIDGYFLASIMLG